MDWKVLSKPSFCPFNNPNPSSSSSSPYNPVGAQTISVWSGSDKINGFQITWRDGNVGNLAGKGSGKMQNLSLGPAETIRTFYMWPTSDLQHIARIFVQTNLNQSLDCGDTDGKSDTQPVQASVESGIPTQYIFNHSGDELIRLAVQFYIPISKIYINPIIETATIEGTNAGLMLLSLSKGTFTNATSTVAHYSFTDTVTKSAGTTHETAVADMVGADVSVSVKASGLFIEATTTATAHWSKTTTDTYSTTERTDLALAWQLTGDLQGSTDPANPTHVTAKTQVWQGVVNLPWKATAEVTFKNPPSGVPNPYTFGVEGIEKNALYSSAFAEVDP